MTIVVLPAPFGPRKPNTSPRSTVIVRPSRARTRPYRLARSTVSTAGQSVTTQAWTITSPEVWRKQADDERDAAIAQADVGVMADDQVVEQIDV